MLIKPFNKYGLTFRTVEEEDASFILELRTDKILSKFLSATSPDIEQQKKWIKNYKQREDKNEEAYFISLDDNGGRQGLNRLYNYNKAGFEIGSWLYKRGQEVSAAILGDLAARDYGFETLGFSTCMFKVRKANLSVIRYHLAFKPEKIKESEIDYYFRLSYNNYKTQRDKLIKMLRNGAR